MKSILIIEELYNSREGLRAETILKLTNFKRRNLYKHLNNLRKKGLVENIYPIWKLTKQGVNFFKSKCLKGSIYKESSNKAQLHNFSFVIRLIRKPDWWDRRENKLLKLQEFKFRKINWGRNPYIQLIKDNYIIQTFSNSIIIISNKKYYGEDSYDCFIKASKELLDLLSYLEEKLKFKFFLDETPQVSVRTHHYVRLRDSLAKKCKKQGNIFEVIIEGKLRLWVDMSEPLGVETGHKNYAPEDWKNYNKQVEDFLINNPPTNSQLASHILNLTQGFDNYGKHIKNHIDSIKSLGSGINKLSDLVVKLGKENRNLKKKIFSKQQINLSKFI